MDSLMTVKEAARYLKLNYMTVYKLAQKGKIPVSKVGGAWRFKREILDDWLLQKASIPRGLVLIVDDDTRVREVMREMVSKGGYAAVAVGSGEAAIDEVSRQHFELIFLDLVLPGLSGIEVLKAIRNKDKEPVIAIVTGYGDDPIALEAMSLGPLLLIRKPFRESDILEVLRIAMKRTTPNIAKVRSNEVANPLRREPGI